MKLAGLGDSNTWGYPLGPDHSWLQDVANELSCQALNHGVNGECFSDMIVRVPEVIKEQPDVIIITGGTNDAFEAISVGHMLRELRAIVDELKENTASRILIGLPIPLDYPAEELLIKQYREGMKIFAGERNIEVIDFYSALVDSVNGGIRAEYNLDGVHPNRKGFERMGKEAVKRIKELGLLG